MRILITGANGFIGSNLVKFLLGKDCEMLALIPENEVCHRIAGELDRITLIRGDLELTRESRRTIADWQPEACINLAWNTGKGYLYSDQNTDLARSSFLFFEDLVDMGVKKIVFTGTCAEYAESPEVLSENSPTGPSTPYADAKLQLLRRILDSTGISRVDFSWARLFFPYGPGEAENRITPAIILALMKGQEFPTTPGEQIRDYLYVEDIASAFYAILQNAGQGIFNVCSGLPVSLKNYLCTVGDLLHKRDLLRIGSLPYREWDPPFIVGDNTRLKNLTGWAPKYTLEEGLTETIAYWKARLENNQGM
jgi:nucleoside-diphosphate-sugar epimerase